MLVDDFLHAAHASGVAVELGKQRGEHELDGRNSVQGRARGCSTATGVGDDGGREQMAGRTTWAKRRTGAGRKPTHAADGRLYGSMLFSA